MSLAGGSWGGFNDSHEILGAKPLRVAAEAFNSLTQPVALNTLTSMFPASLNTLDAIYEPPYQYDRDLGDSVDTAVWWL